jgi:hypothetical protein
MHDGGEVDDNIDDEENSSMHDRGDSVNGEAFIDVAQNEAKHEAGMGWEERIKAWQAPMPGDVPDEAERAGLTPVDPYEAYRQILKDAEASTWLLSTLNRDLTLRGIIPSAMQAIRRTILETLREYEPRRASGGKIIHASRWKISPRRDPQTYVAHFELGWDPVAFLDYEFSEGEPREFISRIITVTGEEGALQALPCQDYMMQTWPCTAANLLSLIQRLVLEPCKSHEGETPFRAPADFLLMIS